MDIDPPPTPAPSSGSSGNSGGGSLLIDPHLGCVQTPIPVGTRVTIVLGTGFPTEAEAQASLDSAHTTITINGELFAVRRYRRNWPFDPPLENGTLYDYGTEANWTPTAAGTYTIIGTDEHKAATCVVTVQ
jgi:hypothetical protein